MMATRNLYIARHGDADAFGNLTVRGREQARLLGRRLAHLPIGAIWHSPLPRAADSARELNIFLTGKVTVGEAPELIDHVPYVPTPAETPRAWVPFFDGYEREEADAGHAIAESLTGRFGTVGGQAMTSRDEDMHEVLITHAYPIAWLVRDALDAPPQRWLGLNSANTALTVIEHRPQLPPTIIMFNDMGHLPSWLQWTGFPEVPRP
ncbi:probable phosphoglycerate mutase [Brevibacterium sp. 239c]|nr:probable phosphoglycerate mutase [Brevibacterium sp. 239c]